MSLVHAYMTRELNLRHSPPNNKNTDLNPYRVDRKEKQLQVRPVSPRGMSVTVIMPCILSFTCTTFYILQ